MLLLSILYIGFVVFHPRYNLNDIHSSLLGDEIAITFLNQDVLLLDVKKERFLFNMGNQNISSLVKKYNLKNIQIYKYMNREPLPNLLMEYSSSGFSISYNGYKFCVVHFMIVILHMYVTVLGI